MRKMRKPKICIVGPGVVGQATGKVLVLHGFDTIFLGGSDDKTKKLRSEGYTAYERDKFFDGSYDFDVTFLTVPTPTLNGRIDLSAIESASVALGQRLAGKKKYHLIVVKSTVPPGTTEDLVINTVEKYSGRKAGEDLGFCMNPEYLREKTAYEDSLKPWIIVIGEYDKKSGDMLSSVFSKFDCPIFRCSLKEAEFQKYVHNLYNAAKITFFNEMRQIGKEFGLDTETIFKISAISSEGMWNPKYGIRDLGPFQGSCLPKDTQAFLEFVKKNGLEAQLLESIIKVNEMLEEAVSENGKKRQNIIVGSGL